MGSLRVGAMVQSHSGNSQEGPLDDPPLDRGAARTAARNYVELVALLVRTSEERPTLAHLQQALRDAAYVQTLVLTCRQPQLKAFAEEVL